MFCRECGTENENHAKYCRSCGAPVNAMGTVEAATSDQPTREYAGFWIRVGAYLIDSIILSVVGSIVFIFFVMIVGVSAVNTDFVETGELSGETIAAVLIFYLAFLIISTIGTWLYFALMESSKMQATLGKRAVGIVVTDMYGKRISFGRATGRYFGTIISGLVFCIGYIMVGFTEKKQGLHDMMAGTLVVKN